jgi:hypothetical protein
MLLGSLRAFLYSSQLLATQSAGPAAPTVKALPSATLAGLGSTLKSGASSANGAGGLARGPSVEAVPLLAGSGGMGGSRTGSNAA